jgi:lysozyme family protein
MFVLMSAKDRVIEDIFSGLSDWCINADLFFAIKKGWE